MFGLIRLLMRLVWLGLFVLGISKAMDLYHKGSEELAGRIQRGDTSGLAGTCIGVLSQVHDALHERAEAPSDRVEDYVGAHDEP